MNTTLFGDLFRAMKPCPAQYAIFVFPAKRPLETKICSFIFRKRVASQAGFFIYVLQSHKLSVQSERFTLASICCYSLKYIGYNYRFVRFSDKSSERGRRARQ